MRRIEFKPWEIGSPEETRAIRGAILKKILRRLRSDREAFQGGEDQWETNKPGIAGPPGGADDSLIHITRDQNQAMQ